jgi:hypothetical protein
MMTDGRTDRQRNTTTLTVVFRNFSNAPKIVQHSYYCVEVKRHSIVYTWNCEEPFHQQVELKFREETNAVLHLSTTLYGAGSWTLRKVDQKYLEKYEMWCWRITEISWTDHVRTEEVTHSVKGKRNLLLLHRMKRRKVTWIARHRKNIDLTYRGNTRYKQKSHVQTNNNSIPFKI